MAFVYGKKRRIFYEGDTFGEPSEKGKNGRGTTYPDAGQAQRARGGKPLLICSFSYPQTLCEGCDKFLTELVEGCEKWAEVTLFRLLSGEYDADPDPKKRFHPAARYSLDCEAVSEEPLSVIVRASLRLPDGERVASRRGFVFSTEDGGVLPPEAFFDRRTLSRYRRSLSRGYCVREGKFYALSDEENESVLMENLINVKSKENN